MKEHFLEGKRIGATLAWTAPSALGISMISPHYGIALLLCSFSVIGTFVLYFEEIKTMHKVKPSCWPWIGLLFIAVEIFLPGYLLYAKADEPKPSIINNGSSTGQSGGETGGTINNNQQNKIENGPTFNGNCNANGSENNLCNNYYGPQRLQVTDALITEIEKSLKNKDIEINYGGGQSDRLVVIEIARRLKADGFNVQAILGADNLAFKPKPEKKLQCTILGAKA